MVLLAVILLVCMLASYSYAIITKRFDSSRRWDLPSRVYSDATPVVPGLSYPRSLLEPKLNYTGYREVESKVAQPGEYRYAGDDLEIYLQNFEYPDMEFHAMPVLVFSWARLPQEGFRALTAALIVVMLVVLLLINFTAIYLRNRYEKTV